MMLLAIILLILAGYWISPRPSMAYFILGFGAGVLCCACIIAFILPRFWPLTREILNWDRVAQLIKEHDDRAAYNNYPAGGNAGLDSSLQSGVIGPACLSRSVRHFRP